MEVTPVEPVGWFSPYDVDNNVRVNTVDVYTYCCTSDACDNKFKCCHVEAVTKYVEGEMDKYCEELQKKKSKN
jgi:hypothetical protein